MQQAGILEPGVEAGQLPADGRWQQGQVGNALQVLGDRPEIILRRHPAQVVEAGQVDGAAASTAPSMQLAVRSRSTRRGERKVSPSASTLYGMLSRYRWILSGVSSRRRKMTSSAGVSDATARGIIGYGKICSSTRLW